MTRILEAGGNIIGKATCEVCAALTVFPPLLISCRTCLTARHPTHRLGGLLKTRTPKDLALVVLARDAVRSLALAKSIWAWAVTREVASVWCVSLVTYRRNPHADLVVQPAAFCGLVGLKPTLGLVPYTGVLSSEANVDYVGPMTKTVLDNALLLEIVAGYDGIDDRQLGAPARAFVPHYANDVLSSRRPEYPLMGTRIGILQQGIELPRLQPQVGRLFELAVQRFRHLGAQVTSVSIPRHREILPAMTVVNKMGSSQTRIGRQCQRRALYLNEYFEKLLPWDQAKWDRAHTYVKNTSLCAEYAWGGAGLRYATAYGRAVNQIRKLKEEYDAVLKECDVLIMPTVPFTAKRHSSPDGGPWHTHDHYGEWSTHLRASECRKLNFIQRGSSRTRRNSTAPDILRFRFPWGSRHRRTISFSRLRIRIFAFLLVCR